MNGGVLTAPMSESRLEVLMRVKQGRPILQIADDLYITRQAVYRQVGICKKLGLVSGPGPRPTRPEWRVEPLGEALLNAVNHLKKAAGGNTPVKLLPQEARALLFLISEA